LTTTIASHVNCACDETESSSSFIAFDLDLFTVARSLRHWSSPSLVFGFDDPSRVNRACDETNSTPLFTASSLCAVARTLRRSSSLSLAYGLLPRPSQAVYIAMKQILLPFSLRPVSALWLALSIVRRHPSGLWPLTPGNREPCKLCLR
jgi:hypothetical protein